MNIPFGVTLSAEELNRRIDEERSHLSRTRTHGVTSFAAPLRPQSPQATGETSKSTSTKEGAQM